MNLAVEDLSAIREGAALSGVLPYLEEALNSMEDQLEGRVFASLNEGTLTPELALYAWMEKQSYRRLMRRFNQKVQIGLSVSQENQEELDGTQ